MRKRIFFILFLLFSLFLTGCDDNKRKHTVKFYDGDELLKTEEVLDGSSATAPDVLKEGYDFIGWDKEFSNITSNLDVNALFEIQTFTVKFYVFNDVYYEEVVEYNKSATSPSDPQVEGMYFTGWSGDYENVKTNLSIRANFTSSPTFKVNFIDGITGFTLKTDFVKLGGNATAPEVDDNKLGYIFSGWSESFENVTTNIDVLANYTEVQERYTITKDPIITLDCDTTNLLYNTYVTLTFESPQGEVVTELYVNGVLTPFRNNYHSFYLKENTTLTVKTITGAQVSTVQIFYLNDLHGSILKNASDPTYHEIGLAKISNFIKTKREENPNSIFIAGGDMLQGSALSNYRKGVWTLDLLEMMGLDSFIIGNHEFDWGIEEVTKHFTGQNPKYSFPLLAANIFRKGTNDLLPGVDPYQVIERGGIRFGIIGYIGEGLESSIATSRVKDYEFRNPVPIISDYASYLRTHEQVDFVIAVGHDGGSSASTRTNNQIRNLTGNSRVDLIFNGHTHRSYIDLYGVPIIQSRANGVNLGHLEVNNVNGVVSVNTDSIRNYSYYDSTLFETPDQTILAQIDAYLAETDPIFKAPIISNLNFIPKATFGAWLTKLMTIKTGSDVGTYNSGGIRADLPEGDITIETLYKILPFDDMIKSCVLKGTYVHNEISSQIDYIRDGITVYENGEYRVVTNDYVYDKENGPYMLYGYSEIIYDGNIRDWVIEELSLQAAAGLTFDVNNPILSQTIDPISVRSDRYYVKAFI
jgi:5'-nucleotidase/UDP-sugar diphosphatase